MATQSLQDSEHRYRMTNQRKVILEEVRKANTHRTADEVYEVVRKRLPRISLGTVYRNLETLSASGLIQKVGPPSSQMRFDGKTHNHYHIRCVSCGRVDDAPIESLGEVEKELRTFSDYNVLGHRLEFIGLCPECKEAENHCQKSSR